MKHIQEQKANIKKYGGWRCSKCTWTNEIKRTECANCSTPYAEGMEIRKGRRPADEAPKIKTRREGKTQESRRNENKRKRDRRYAKEDAPDLTLPPPPTPAEKPPADVIVAELEKAEAVIREHIERNKEDPKVLRLGHALYDVVQEKDRFQSRLNAAASADQGTSSSPAIGEPKATAIRSPQTPARTERSQGGKREVFS